MIDNTIDDFLEKLGSKASTPGGGSAAAVTGAIGIGLTQMVVSLTAGKKAFADSQLLLNKVGEQAILVMEAFKQGIENDIKAFDEVMNAYRLPATTPCEQDLKKQAIEETSKQATLAPYQLMETSVKALKLSNQLLGCSNPNVISDLGVAALNLSASLQSSWLNVLINLGNIEDQLFVETYKSQGEQLLTDGKEIAEDLYIKVLNELS